MSYIRRILLSNESLKLNYSSHILGTCAGFYSHFETREELIWVIVASMCLPIAFILDFPVNCGSKIGLCFDGGFSNDSPCLDSYTITVSALHRYCC